jgi:ribonuclease HI
MGLGTMPWIEASLRGQKVLARARQDGTLAAEGGRVEIRYRPTDAKAYRASASNLVVATGASLLPDDTCVPASAEPERGGAARPSSHQPQPVPKGAWQAFTDGACSGNPGPAGSGVVLVEPGGKIHEGYEYLGESTNNVAELTAILRALEWIPAGAAAIVVHTDSKYAIGVLSKGWKAKANQELIARARKLVEQRRPQLRYVPGHDGVPLNERADELARGAVTSRQTRVARVDG